MASSAVLATSSVSSASRVSSPLRCRSTSAQPTRPCDRPDWILVTDDITVDQVQIGTLPASDHLPLIARITLG